MKPALGRMFTPEQARGKSVDKRTDIWAFGVVLYEFVLGEQPFKGDDLTEILASVVKDSPDLAKAPIKVRRLLASCLEKDPKRRLRDIGDAWRLLDEPVVASKGGIALGRRCGARSDRCDWLAATRIGCA